MTERARETLHEARDAARESLTQATATAGAVGERASARVRDAMPAAEDRNNYLLGAAALAVAAAVGIAYQRRLHGSNS